MITWLLCAEELVGDKEQGDRHKASVTWEVTENGQTAEFERRRNHG